MKNDDDFFSVVRMKISFHDILFTTAVLFAAWFCLAGWLWMYYVNLMIAYPFGLAALVIWIFIKRDGRKRNRMIPVLLVAGLTISLSVLFFYWARTL